MLIPANGERLKKENDVVSFFWDAYVFGMQPGINYAYYFAVEDVNGKKITKLIQGKSGHAIYTKDLETANGFNEVWNYKWSVLAYDVKDVDLFSGRIVNGFAQGIVVVPTSTFVIVPTPVIVPPYVIAAQNGIVNSVVGNLLSGVTDPAVIAKEAGKSVIDAKTQYFSDSSGSNANGTNNGSLPKAAGIGLGIYLLIKFFL